MAATALNPVSRIILQTEDGVYYSLGWDETAGITIAPGSGVGSAVHAGTAYTFSPAVPWGPPMEFTDGSLAMDSAGADFALSG